MMKPHATRMVCEAIIVKIAISGTARLLRATQCDVLLRLPSASGRAIGEDCEVIVISLEALRYQFNVWEPRHINRDCGLDSVHVIQA